MESLKSKLEIASLIAGIIAIIIAISSSNGGLIYQAPITETKQESLKEKGIGYLKEKVLGKQQEPIEPPKPEKTNGLFGVVVNNTLALIAGTIALLLGIFSKFIREERSRKKHDSFYIHFDSSGAGITLGLIALLWSYIIIAVVIGIVIYILSSLMNGNLDIGI